MQLLYIAVLISAGVTINVIDEIDIFDNDDDASRPAEDGDSFRAIAGWLIFIVICGIIFEAVMAIIRALANGEFVIIKFTIYGMVVSLTGYSHMRSSEQNSASYKSC